MVGVGVGGRVDVCGYVLQIWIENHPFAICVLSKRKREASLAFDKTRPELPPHPHHHPLGGCGGEVGLAKLGKILEMLERFL